MYEHYDINAEQSVIFALTTSNQAQQVFAAVKEDDFFDTTCKRRFSHFKKAYNAGQLSEFALQCVDKVDVPSTVIPLWTAIKTVVNHSIRRKIEIAMINVGERCREYCNDISELQGDLRDMILEAIDHRACKGPSLTSDDLDMVISGMSNCVTIFDTGIDAIDRNAPIQPGDFVIVAARPGAGKSALTSSMILENFLTHGRNGLFFCIEMDARQNYARLSSQMSNVPLSKYINPRGNPPTGGEMNAITESFIAIKNKFPERWFIEGSVSLDEICTMTEIYKPQFIVIDYVQIIKSDGEGAERLAKISTTLRMLALEHNIAVIAVAQLNRDADGSVPSMSQIKGSGQFEQDATHIFLLDRPESERTNVVGKRNYFDKRGHAVSIHNPTTPTNRAALICAKNRNGPTFYTILNFDTRTTTFTEYE